MVATEIMGNKEPSEPRTRFDQVSNRALGSCGSSLTAIPVPIAIASISPKHLASWCNCEGPQMAERRSLKTQQKNKGFDMNVGGQLCLDSH